jgi:hypothetical protein
MCLCNYQFFVLVSAGAILDQAFGVALAVVIFYAITQPIFVYGVYRRVGISVREVGLLYLKPTAYAGVSVGLGWHFRLCQCFLTSHSGASPSFVQLLAEPTRS